jgi:hypothetical protein
VGLLPQRVLVTRARPDMLLMDVRIPMVDGLKGRPARAEHHDPTAADRGAEAVENDEYLSDQLRP